MPPKKIKEKKTKTKNIPRKSNEDAKLFKFIEKELNKALDKASTMDEESYNKKRKDDELHSIFQTCNIKSESELYFNPCYQRLREESEMMSEKSTKDIIFRLIGRDYLSEALHWLEKMTEKDEIKDLHFRPLLYRYLIAAYERLHFPKEAMKTCEHVLKLYKSKIHLFDENLDGPGLLYKLCGLSAVHLARYNEAYFYLKKSWNEYLKRPDFDIFDMEILEEEHFCHLFHALRAAFKSKPYEDVLDIINNFPSPILNMKKRLPNGLNVLQFENHLKNLKTVKKETDEEIEKSAEKVEIYMYFGLICQLKGETLIHLNDKTFVDWIKKADKIYNDLLLVESDWPESVKDTMLTNIIAQKIKLLVIFKEFKISDELVMLSSLEELKVHFKEPDLYYFLNVDVKQRFKLNYLRETFETSEDDRFRFMSYKNSLYINSHLRINNKAIIS